jgi:hypothetical protein
VHTCRVGVSESDKERMRKMQWAFKEAETDEEFSPAEEAEVIRRINERRAEAGTSPLLEEKDIDPPEAEFFRRARALGLSRRRG